MCLSIIVDYFDNDGITAIYRYYGPWELMMRAIIVAVEVGDDCKRVNSSRGACTS